jgi:hypothetical protein
LSPRYLVRPSVLILIGANLLPLYGVLRWGWDLYSLLMLYWLETAIIGIFAIIQMAIAARWFALFVVPFFIIHFGGFMLGHLVFLTVLFAPGGAKDVFLLPQRLLTTFSEHGLWLALIALALSQGLSFVLNVVRPIWRRRRNPSAAAPQSETESNPQDVMGATYGRVVILHVTLMFGAMVTELFRAKIAALLLLIVLKTIADMAAYVRGNFDAGQPTR